jgi:alpha-L-fucosidase
MAGLIPVTVPAWWNERRYGMFVHANVATVPSFSPIGEYADWYWSHLGSDVLDDVLLHPTPMAEVLAYHRDRWSHVENFDDFIPFLTYHRFDADEHLDLAADAGMRYLVHVTKHHDGFCWWDAPGTSRTSVLQGPQRNVMAELAESCRRHDITFGTYYSLLDWSDPRYPNDDYVEEVLHRHVLDLVERYGSQILWGDGQWGHGREMWRSQELIEQALDLADAQGYELAVNDRWRLKDPQFRSYEYNAPSEIQTEPWELCRGVGHSFTNNRAERPEHMMSTGALLDLLTEVVAKGGNLLMNVGVAVDGSIPDVQQRPLRAVGAWVRAHADVIHGSRPFDEWGDAQVRYVRVARRTPGDDEVQSVVAIDLAAGTDVTLAALTIDRYEVSSVEADDGGALHWEQHASGVTISRIDRSPTGLAGVYRIALRQAARARRLFEARPPMARPLQPLIDEAVDGDVIQLQEGVYRGPVTVPVGVTLRGLGWDRTSIIGDGQTIAVLEDRARLEHVHLVDGPQRFWNASVASVDIDGRDAAIVGCRCDGHVMIHGDDASVQSVIGAGVVGTAERTTVTQCAFKGMRWDVGVHLTGGSGHTVTRNEIVDHLCAIRLTGATAGLVAENRIEGRWWGIEAEQCDHLEIVDNKVQHTMRAIDVRGGNGSVVTGNWVADGDSGALVQFGATDTSVIDNHVERCRIGILVWDAPSTLIGPNTFVDLHEEDAIVSGPDTDNA